MTGTDARYVKGTQYHKENATLWNNMRKQKRERSMQMVSYIIEWVITGRFRLKSSKMRGKIQTKLDDSVLKGIRRYPPGVGQGEKLKRLDTDAPPFYKKHSHISF